MSTISGMQRLLQASTIKVTVLCVLFGLGGFVSLVGAEIPKTLYEQGELASGGTTIASGTASDIVGISAGDVFVMDVTPHVDSLHMAAAKSQAKDKDRAKDGDLVSIKDKDNDEKDHPQPKGPPFHPPGPPPHRPPVSHDK